MRKSAQSSKGFSQALSRRQFLRGVGTFSAALVTQGTHTLLAADAPPRLRAAIIGDTGHGDYGHGLDVIFSGRPNITVVAVADPDAAGRAKAAARTGAKQGYADYRQMLQAEKPQLVAIGPRWTDQHHAMAAAALATGAHVYLEKPITRTLAEADDLLATARSRGLKIAVAHQMRVAPNVLFLKEQIERGLIGELLEMRACGKQDKRAGGEDLMVLGVHEFNLMRYFAGDPLWCTARILQNGHEITRQDLHAATENIGPIAGDDIVAQFAFPKGVMATFTSRAKNRPLAEPWHLELIGTKGTVRILMDIAPRAYALHSGGWSAQGKNAEWRPIPGDPTIGTSAVEMTLAKANQRVVDDWLAAIVKDREPICSGRAGMEALEMAMAVFAAGLARQRVEFPLKNRQHPLG